MVNELSKKEISKAANDLIRFIESRVGESHSSVELIKKAIDVICDNEVSVQERDNTLPPQRKRFKRQTKQMRRGER